MAKTNGKSRTGKTTKRAAKQSAESALISGGIGDDARAAYDRFLPLAMNLAPSQLVPFRNADTQLALHNVRSAVEILLGARERIKEELPRVNIADLALVPQLALAVRWATVEAARPQDTGRDVTEKLGVAHALRGTLLAIAEGLAAAGLVPASEVRAIRAGRGALDAATDCVALADLFARYQKRIAGKHAATAQMLTGAREVGTYLLQMLKPRRAKRAARGNEVQIEVRDRLWSLLVARYDVARRAAYWLWGEEFAERVPALLAQRRVKAKANGAVATPPSPNGGS